jgi:hypothetical protein
MESPALAEVNFLARGGLEVFYAEGTLSEPQAKLPIT